MAGRTTCFLGLMGTILCLGADLPWPRHVVDTGSKGADGVRLADANHDGRPDIVTGWEEGGVVRLCLNPGPEQVRAPWPSVTVGPARSVEDAVLIDLDADGQLDVVSACEGQAQVLQFHWGPDLTDLLLQPEAWQTQPLLSSRGKTRWMFTLPMNIDGQFGVDLVVGSKNPNGIIGWFQAPRQPRQADEWGWRPLRPAGWIMSMIGTDMDRDGDVDLLFSDRKGPQSGCYWLEKPENPAHPWPEHLVGAAGREVMFIAQGDLNQDGLRDVVAAVRPRSLLVFERRNWTGQAWRERTVAWPDAAGGAKAVAVGDLNQDGRLDLVCSCEGAAGRMGVFWMDLGRQEELSIHDISGLEGTKFDLVELLDLDADGDLDVLTCEEKENLGVIWYENPGR